MGTDWQNGDYIENRWEIHKILHGGMGVVYVVYDHQFEEPAAVKTVDAEMFARNPASLDAFTREALVWVNLDAHQNITQAKHVKQINGKPFLFLEYVSGGDLGAWIGTPRLTEDSPQVLRFAIEVCDGMIHARSKGVEVHRDLKPQNCLITPDGTLKVTDFGLAKVLDHAPADARQKQTRDVEGLSLSMSRTGAAAGTAPYMAPEQFEDFKHVDGRADIYSFGVMLFQMLTGRLPFVARGWEEARRLHKQEPPPRLGGQPRVIEKIVRKCLAKAPEARWQDFAQLRERLERAYEYLTGATAPQAPTGQELDFYERANKGSSLAALGRHNKALACYERALEINPRSAIVWSNKGNTLKALGRLEEALVCHERALERNAEYDGAWVNKGCLLADLRGEGEALACFERAVEIYPLSQPAWYNKGLSLAALGRHEEALASYERALEIDPQKAEVRCSMGALLADLGRREEAIACYEQALEINPRHELTWYNKGTSLLELGSHDEALACYERALEINPDSAQAWNNKGNTLFWLERHEEAMACYERALEINPLQADTWFSKGACLAKRGQWEKALPNYEKARELGQPRAPQAIAMCRQRLVQ